MILVQKVIELQAISIYACGFHDVALVDVKDLWRSAEEARRAEVDGGKNRSKKTKFSFFIQHFSRILVRLISDYEQAVMSSLLHTHFITCAQQHIYICPVNNNEERL